jgi:hypothetical protein
VRATLAIVLVTVAASGPSKVEAGPRTDFRGLRLTISSPQREVLVGEPLNIAVVWDAIAPLPPTAVEDDEFLFQSLGLVVRRGAARYLWEESARRIAEEVLVPRAPKPGRPVHAEYVFYQGWLSAWDRWPPISPFLFPEAGEYSIAAIYMHRSPSGDRVPTGIASNVIRFQVSEPSGDDAKVLEHIRRQPWYPSQRGRLWGIDPDLKVVESVVAQYPASRYVRLARLELLRLRSRQPNGTPPAQVTAECLEKLGEVLSAEWGAFTPEALRLAISYADCAGDTKRADALRKKLAKEKWRPTNGRR